ncbi:MAG: DUF3179 domain-containing (seleno)protein [Firmicutes bacterium]|uniref:DUF3179 domain-containing protein n=1 Tax=Melghirimyces thermohalophilus TaxID=1236220 RepID=A0A1G6QKM5_9BACL|nr:DUF3179 domain-containing (seleno)protein [Melghirimyces thermohalophilus]MDA8353974.1 DUF3179 domain-containing (seleno)protein [Bacillota bacterium]SDC92979.1 Protein of unknown function [Melghirimyces thermohalophilus]
MELDFNRFSKQSFQPFPVESTEPLKNAVGRREIKKDDTVLVVGRGGERLAFWMYQMTYHHVAQGKLAGEPYIVNY